MRFLKNSKIVNSLFVRFIIVLLIISIVLCGCGHSGYKLVDYTEYIRSFIIDGEFSPFELINDIDLRTTLYQADLLVKNGYGLSDNDKNTIEHAFREQMVADSYSLKPMMANDKLELWELQLSVLSEVDKEECKYIAEQAEVMLIDILCDWDGTIEELSINEDCLTKLNVLLMLKNINRFVCSAESEMKLAQLIAQEWEKYNSGYYSYDGISVPALYYFINLDCDVSIEWMQSMPFLDEIEAIMQILARDGYSGYYFYLPFFCDVLEYYQPGLFEALYGEYNAKALEYLIKENKFDCSSLWTAIKYTGHIIDEETKADLIKMFGISAGTTIGQNQIVFLSPTYENIYEFLYLSNAAKVQISKETHDVIEMLLADIKDNPNRTGMIDYYYELKIREMGLFESSCLQPVTEIENRIKTAIFENRINPHDAGAIYYLMLIQSEFHFVDEESILHLIAQQKDILADECSDESLYNVLLNLQACWERRLEKFDEGLLQENDSFLDVLYFWSHFSRSSDAGVKKAIIENIQARETSFGYSDSPGSKGLDLRATYRIVYACDNLGI